MNILIVMILVPYIIEMKKEKKKKVANFAVRSLSHVNREYKKD
jgi:hypothetical protein